MNVWRRRIHAAANRRRRKPKHAGPTVAASKSGGSRATLGAAARSDTVNGVAFRSRRPDRTKCPVVWHPFFVRVKGRLGVTIVNISDLTKAAPNAKSFGIRRAYPVTDMRMEVLHVCPKTGDNVPMVDKSTADDKRVRVRGTPRAELLRREIIYAEVRVLRELIAGGGRCGPAADAATDAWPRRRTRGPFYEAASRIHLRASRLSLELPDSQPRKYQVFSITFRYICPAVGHVIYDGRTVSPKAYGLQKG